MMLKQESNPKSTPLSNLLLRQIALDGPIRFDAFMQACMGMAHKDQRQAAGYYQSQLAVGKQGDFITSPEMSQVFGEALGLWLLDRWLSLGSPSDFALLELGPGRGILMQDALRLLAKISPSFCSGMRLHLLEQNPILKEEQSARLQASKPTWHETLNLDATGLAGLPLLILSNEFFDALPVRAFRFGDQDQGWAELFVTASQGGHALPDRSHGAALNEAFAFTLSPLHNSTLPSGWQSHAPGADPKPGHWYEVSPTAMALFSDLCDHVVGQGGAILTVDYGYGSRACEQADLIGKGSLSLQAVRQHQMVSLFDEPGLSDISAHVDFDRLSRLSTAAGLKAWPLMTQAEGLKALGGEILLQRLMHGQDQVKAQKLADAFERLIASAKQEDMGYLFKFHCVTDSAQSAWFKG